MGSSGASGGGGGAVALISSQTLGATTAVVKFTAIPSGYNHLRVVAVARGTNASETDNIQIGLNNFANGCDYNYTTSTNGAVTATAAGNQGAVTLSSSLLAASSTAGNASLITVDVPLYAGATFFKALYFKVAAEDSAAGVANSFNINGMGKARQTAAVTEIDFRCVLGSYASGSSFYLYGIT